MIEDVRPSGEVSWSVGEDKKDVSDGWAIGDAVLVAEISVGELEDAAVANPSCFLTSLGSGSKGVNECDSV